MQKDLKKIFGEHHGLDDRTIEFLTKALEKNNLPGFDYLEFKQSLGALAAMNLDESIAIKSAYATASMMGLTKEKLLQTATHYITVLNKEKQQFDAALEKQVQQRIKFKQDEVQALRKSVEEHKKTIADLQVKIEEAIKIIEAADAEMSEAREKLEGTKKNFEFTLQSIINQIEKDIEQIDKTL